MTDRRYLNESIYAHFCEHLDTRRKSLGIVSSPQEQGAHPTGLRRAAHAIDGARLEPGKRRPRGRQGLGRSAFRALLLKDGTAACAQFGYTGPQGEYIVALEDTPQLKNVIVCSLCSCTNWPVLGLPPEWYKGFEFRARLVREGRTVLRELGTELPNDMVVKVWDTSAESRYLVLPVRPEGTEHMSEEQLQALVTKDVLIGVALPRVD